VACGVEKRSTFKNMVPSDRAANNVPITMTHIDLDAFFVEQAFNPELNVSQ
jgi:hypothetical protein